MIIAFGGLLGSNCNNTNNISWLLTTSVFFDTFVVRTIMVPSLMSIVKDYHWYPFTLKKLNKINLKNEFCQVE